MGRSPPFATFNLVVLLPALSSISPGCVVTSPGMRGSLAFLTVFAILISHDFSLYDWIMDGHKLGPIRESGLDLNIGNHFRHTFHHIGTCKNLAAL